MSSTQYDFIFVGASPIMSMFAAKMAQNHRVLLIDKRTEVGGVWQSGEFDGKEFSCMVPHVLEPHPGLYRFLEKALDIKMDNVFDYCCVAFQDEIFGGKLHAYTLYHLHRLTTEQVFNKIRFMEGQGVDFATFVQNTNRDNPVSFEHYRPLHGIPIGVEFFEGGTKMFRRALRKKLDESGCDVLLESAVKHLNVMGDQVVVELDDGSKVTTANVQLSQHMDVPTIELSGKGEFKPKHLTYHNNCTLHLKLRGSNQAKFFYAYFPMSDYVYIASRLDYYLEDIEDGVSYFAITLKKKFAIDEAFVKTVVADVAQTGLISADVEVEAFQLVEENRSRFEQIDMVELANRSNGRVKVKNMTKTGGLARAFYDNMHAFV